MVSSVFSIVAFTLLVPAISKGVEVTDLGHASINQHQSLIRKDASAEAPAQKIQLPQAAGMFRACNATQTEEIEPKCGNRGLDHVTGRILIECKCFRVLNDNPENTCCRDEAIPETVGVENE